MEPLFFADPAQFRAWLEEHHEQADALLVGYYKKGTGRPSMTWPESVDEALCYGWIDGVRKGIDSESYMIRFTPRKPSSIWSTVNVKRVAELTELGRMRPAGLHAFEKRREDKTGIYSHEQKIPAELGGDYEAIFRANAKAWEFFQSRSASYRKTSIHWIVSAKKEETRMKRLNALIAASEQGLTVDPFTRKPKPAP
ncbi:YdeI/OmpD-associated family protein [Paenibacillus doosanensis]|uniref:Bacteriocin-protection protein n=1 Tax=Paenibacillus konkukensis TaxID=2020716 RepID=A0ABY4RNU1_9BACL|nr:MULTISPECIES: YdeI/OmpD-associated family protein [Paenibacillus]MCS7459082.1 YdeI/OmpD-associated family protein [Paenibacillus doosanensis]UQZ84136.1 hypothetical protein SK3146_03369 [Paenibacillus konkukensis]